MLISTINTNREAAMATTKFALAALLLGTAGACCAQVPVIQLAPSLVERAGHAGHGAGSFAAYAGGAVSVVASAAARMPLTAGALVAARPQPSPGAALVLLLACLIHLGRRRRHGFALRPSTKLSERLGHAPADA
jgi:hypothetical protein